MVAVDLTPVLPGGDNGGAKLFMLELMRRLPKLAPETQFVLLTQAASHEELALLDRPNVRRLMVIGPQPPPRPVGRTRAAMQRVLGRLPGRAQRLLARLQHRLAARRARSSTRSALADTNPDLLFCPFTAPTYEMPGAATVCTLYDLQYKAYPQFFDAADLMHREHTFRQACRRADALAAISEYSRQEAIAHGNLDPARICTIHLRMARRATSSPDLTAALLARLGLQPGRYLLYPANFWRHKNHEMLLAALSIARRDGLPDDISLVCTGAPGARQQYLVDAARALGLGPRVVFPGFLPDAELQGLLTAAAGVVYPSLFEGFGLPVLEAMAAGVPVACSRITSLPEVAAGAAWLFDPRIPAEIARSMIALVTDQAGRAELVEAGERRAAEYADSDRMAREYWDLFRVAMRERRRENQLVGVFPDGWLGTRLDGHVVAGEPGRSLRFELQAPGWSPHPTVRMRAAISGESREHRLAIARGGTASWSLPIGPDGGSIRIEISPGFVPAEVVASDDQRVLTSTLIRCEIVGRDGTTSPLHPPALS